MYMSWWYVDVKIATIDLRRICDLIDKINNIVDVEQDEINDKIVEFEKFDLHQKFEIFEFCCIKLICDVIDFWLIKRRI